MLRDAVVTNSVTLKLLGLYAGELVVEKGVNFREKTGKFGVKIRSRNITFAQMSFRRRGTFRYEDLSQILQSCGQKGDILKGRYTGSVENAKQL